MSCHVMSCHDMKFHEISYPYGGTVNFKICLDVQLTIHQPPMPNSSQTSAWSHRYIGRGNGKTEIPLLDSERISKNWISKTDGSPIGFIAILWRLKTCKIALVKVVDFDHLRALFGPGAPDADLSIFKLGFSHELIMHNTARWIHRRAAQDTCTQSFRWIHVRRHIESHTKML